MNRACKIAAAAFADHYGEEPRGVSFAPGRVNLIGEHVDYNDGLVLPMPVARGTAVAWGRSADAIEVYAADLGASDRFAPGNVPRIETPDWRSYIRGMASSEPAPLPPMRLAIAGDLQRGAGLSSSASLCVALGRAFAAARARQADALELAKRAQRTEHEYVGVACGIMDQMAVAAGEAGHAMLLDCRDLTHRQIRLPPSWRVAVIDSGVTRGLVEGEYNLRRAQCEAAARKIGVTSLRDATLERMARATLDSVEHRRARHVVEEIARTEAAARALEASDIASFGALMGESHASLRDLFEVSVAPVDRLVERLQHAIGPAGGARMTGGGFGGAVVAVFEHDRADAVREAAGERSLEIV